VSASVVDSDWCADLPRLLHDAAKSLHAPQRAWYRFGDAVVEILSDHEPLLRELEDVYGDCKEAREPSAGEFGIACTGTLVRGGRLLALTFVGVELRHPIEIALGPYRFLRRAPYVEAPAPIPGWRSLESADSGSRALIASDGRTAIIDLEQAPPEFVLDCIVGVVQAAQKDTLFLHAASVGVAGSGALIFAPSFGGKSTTALALALRGHAFLGDDVAAVRLSARELLPFPKSAGIRDGPLFSVLAERLRSCRQTYAPGRHRILRRLVRVSDLFPWSTSGPLPLRFAFLLDGFGNAAKITPFEPKLGELRRLRSMVVMDTMSSWGMSPGRDLMLLLTVLRLLSELRCFLVEHGSPEQTASLIERTIYG
jgi:hypothetical protein